MITVTIAGLPEMIAKVQARRDRLEHLQPGLLRAGASVLKAAQQRIESGGGDTPWAPNLSGTPLLHATGRLFGSLSVGGAGNVTDSDDRHITVGTNVQVGDWNLGTLMQGGTGIYAGGERITPKSSKALAFAIRGKRIFATSIAGSPKRPFLYVDEAVAKNVQRILGSYIGGA